MKIKISVKNTEVIKRKLDKLGNEIKNFEREFEEIGRDILQFTEQVFASRGQRLLGQNWEPLNPEYQKWKDQSKYGTGSQILVLSGKMRRSFKAISSTNFLRVYNTVDYFSKHQIGKGKTPQRMMLGINNDVVKIIKNEFAKGIKRKLDSVTL